jgi:hypothetical protein
LNRSVPRWRAPASSGGLGRATSTTCAAFLADRLAIGEQNGSIQPHLGLGNAPAIIQIFLKVIRRATPSCLQRSI